MPYKACIDWAESQLRAAHEPHKVSELLESLCASHAVSIDHILTFVSRWRPQLREQNIGADVRAVAVAVQLLGDDLTDDDVDRFSNGELDFGIIWENVSCIAEAERLKQMCIKYILYLWLSSGGNELTGNMLSPILYLVAIHQAILTAAAAPTRGTASEIYRAVDALDGTDMPGETLRHQVFAHLDNPDNKIELDTMDSALASYYFNVSQPLADPWVCVAMFPGETDSSAVPARVLTLVRRELWEYITSNLLSKWVTERYRTIMRDKFAKSYIDSRNRPWMEFYALMFSFASVHHIHDAHNLIFMGTQRLRPAYGGRDSNNDLPTLHIWNYQWATVRWADSVRSFNGPMCLWTAAAVWLRLCVAHPRPVWSEETLKGLTQMEKMTHQQQPEQPAQ